MTKYAEPTETMLNNIQKLTRDVHILERSLYQAYRFTEAVYELAFGADAMERGYSDQEVLHQLRLFSDTALKGEEPPMTQAEVDALLTSFGGGMYSPEQKGI